MARLMTDYMTGEVCRELIEYIDSGPVEVEEDLDMIQDYFEKRGEPYAARDLARLHKQWANCCEYYLLSEFLDSLLVSNELGGEAGAA